MDFKEYLKEKKYEKPKGFKYIVKVETMDSKYNHSGKSTKVIEEKPFNDEKSANKYKKLLIKKYKLIKHAGHIVNYKDQIELWTNY